MIQDPDDGTDEVDNSETEKEAQSRETAGITKELEEFVNKFNTNVPDPIVSTVIHKTQQTVK